MPADRDAFLQAEIAASPAGAERTLYGLRRGGRNYLALPCRCGFDRCPGWALVHDDPGAIALHTRLFIAGRPEAEAA